MNNRTMVSFIIERAWVKLSWYGYFLCLVLFLISFLVGCAIIAVRFFDKTFEWKSWLTDKTDFPEKFSTSMRHFKIL